MKSKAKSPFKPFDRELYKKYDSNKLIIRDYLRKNGLPNADVGLAKDIDIVDYESSTAFEVGTKTAGKPESRPSLLWNSGTFIHDTVNIEPRKARNFNKWIETWNNVWICYLNPTLTHFIALNVRYAINHGEHRRKENVNHYSYGEGNDEVFTIVPIRYAKIVDLKGTERFWE